MSKKFTERRNHWFEQRRQADLNAEEEIKKRASLKELAALIEKIGIENRAEMKTIKEKEIFVESASVSSSTGASGMGQLTVASLVLPLTRDDRLRNFSAANRTKRRNADAAKSRALKAGRPIAHTKQVAAVAAKKIAEAKKRLGRPIFR